MIYESHFWKEEIGRIAKRMRARATQKRWPAKSEAKVEIDVFFVFYAIRKLLEAQKLSIHFTELKLPVKAFLSVSHTYRRNRHRLEEGFDLENPNEEELELRELCNQIVHSYIFSIVRDEETRGLSGIVFCSDKKRNQKMYYLELSSLTQLLDEIANDYPQGTIMYYDSIIGDDIVINHNSLPWEFDATKYIQKRLSKK